MPRRSLISPRRSSLVRPLPDEATRHLGALVARRRQLLEMLVAERNRRQAADLALHERIDAHLRWLEEALAEIELDLDGAVRDSPDLACQGGAAPLGAGRRTRERTDPAGRVARARLPHPSSGCGPGRGGTIQPRQRQDAGPTDSLGWPGAVAGLPLYGCRRGCPGQQPGDRQLLSTAPTGREACYPALTACMRKLVVTLNAMLRTNTAWRQA